jgi:hypothetical protein
LGILHVRGRRGESIDGLRAAAQQFAPGIVGCECVLRIGRILRKPRGSESRDLRFRTASTEAPAVSISWSGWRGFCSGRRSGSSRSADAR